MKHSYSDVRSIGVPRILQWRGWRGVGPGPKFWGRKSPSGVQEQSSVRDWGWIPQKL